VPTYGGTAMVAIDANRGASLRRQGLYGLAIGSNTGAKTVQMTTSESIDKLNWFFTLWCDVHQTTSFGTITGATGGDAAPKVTVADTANGEVVINLFHGHENSNPFTATQILINYTFSAGEISVGMSKTTATGANTVLDWSSGTANGWHIVGVALKNAPVVNKTGQLRRRGTQ
jgi:hypothetical protein